MDWMFLAKALVSGLVAAGASEAMRRVPSLAALLVSLPLTTLMAFVWSRLGGMSDKDMAAVSMDVMWMVVPSLVLFPAFAYGLRSGWGFWPALAGGCVGSALAYLATARTLGWI